MGFSKIIKGDEGKFPDFIMLRSGKEVKVELETISSNFILHKHEPSEIDYVVCIKKDKELNKKDLTEEESDEVCEKCGKPMVIKWGRFGQFLSCSAYPDCKNAKPVPTGAKCPEPNCGGDLVERKARGRHFYGCTNYPTCRHTAQRLPKSEGESSGGESPDAEGNGTPPASEQPEQPQSAKENEGS